MPPAAQRRNIQQQLNVLLESSKNKSYFVAAVTVGFVVLMILVGVLPSYSAFTAQAEKNAKKQEAIDKLEAKKTALEDLVEDEKNKVNLFNLFNTILPDQPEQVAVLKEVKEISEINEVLLLSSSFSEARTNAEVIKKFKTSKQLKAQTLNILLEGTRENLNNFIGDLERDIRVLDVKNMALSRKVGKELEESDPDREYKLNAQIDYFYYDKTVK
jgi:hypothetical protein